MEIYFRSAGCGRSDCSNHPRHTTLGHAFRRGQCPSSNHHRFDTVLDALFDRSYCFPSWPGATTRTWRASARVAANSEGLATDYRSCCGRRPMNQTANQRTATSGIEPTEMPVGGSLHDDWRSCKGWRDTWSRRFRRGPVVAHVGIETELSTRSVGRSQHRIQKAILRGNRVRVRRPSAAQGAPSALACRSSLSSSVSPARANTKISGRDIRAGRRPRLGSWPPRWPRWASWR